MAYYITILTYYPDTFQKINTWGEGTHRRLFQKLQKVKCNSLLQWDFKHLKTKVSDIAIQKPQTTD